METIINKMTQTTNDQQLQRARQNWAEYPSNLLGPGIQSGHRLSDYRQRLETIERGLFSSLKPRIHFLQATDGSLSMSSTIREASAEFPNLS